MTEPTPHQLQPIKLIGRLTSKPELCSTWSGTVSTLRIAVQRRRGSDDQGRDADLIEVTAFENCRVEPCQTTIG
jgi:single-stranded DNA-binding protein